MSAVLHIPTLLRFKGKIVQRYFSLPHVDESVTLRSCEAAFPVKTSLILGENQSVYFVHVLSLLSTPFLALYKTIDLLVFA